MARYNPFRPGNIVSPGMFSGRYEELEGTEHALFQTKNGNPHHFLIEGERGIGKSSLLFSLQMVASGLVDPLEGSKFNFLTLSLELEPEIPTLTSSAKSALSYGEQSPRTSPAWSS